LDHAEGLSLSQFFREWGFVSFKSSSICNFFILILFFLWIFVVQLLFCSSMFCFRFPARCAEITARGRN
jgi:hypothetical protein